MANPICIDLSHHNPTPDFAKLKANGTLGIIHKATEGTSYKDSTLYSRIKAAREAGLVTSTYHFLRPGSINAQMDWYLKAVDPLPGERLCLDHEDAGFSLADLEKAVRYLADKRPDCPITIYSGHVIKEQLGSKRSDTLAELTSLWVAQYTSAAAPTWPGGTWDTWSLWQYTDKASAAGVSQPVDGNRWNGSEENFLKWLGGYQAQPEPAPEPEPVPPFDLGPVRVDIQTPVGVRVTVAVNGAVVV